MAILIQDAVFATNGAEIKATSLYIDVMIVFPHGTENVEARLMPYAFDGEEKTSGPLNIDGVHQFSFSPMVLVTDDFWSDVNAGNAHNYIISQLEAETPAWAGKITKTIPIQ